MNCTIISQLDEIQRLINEHRTVAVRGGGSKVRCDSHSASFDCQSSHSSRSSDFGPASQSEACAEHVIDLSHWQGITEYDSSEFTITAKAGTPIRVLQEVLAQQGQYLPFDPVRVEQGATLGGTIACGIAGPSRFRFGGIRDFVLGLQLVDGTGQVATVGGKVVKNSAGFDIPKLFVGSWGRLGIIVEATLKVFPKPDIFRSVAIPFASLSEALSAQQKLVRSPIEIDAVDIDENQTLHVRVGGTPQIAEATADRICSFLSANSALHRTGDQESDFWKMLVDWSFAGDDSYLVRLPIGFSQIEAVESLVRDIQGVRRRYCLAANVAWLAIPRSAGYDKIHEQCATNRLQGRIIDGRRKMVQRIGCGVNSVFADRVTLAFDPHRKFVLADQDFDKTGNITS